LIGGFHLAILLHNIELSNVGQPIRPHEEGVGEEKLGFLLEEGWQYSQPSKYAEFEVKGSEHG